MGLSQSHSHRNSAEQKESLELSLTQDYAKSFQGTQDARWRMILHVVELASQQSVWLERMQEQLQKTAIALRKRPSSVLSLFRKTLSRPINFYAPAESAEWLILLGPKPLAKAEKTSRSWQPVLRTLPRIKTLDRQPAKPAPALKLAKAHRTSWMGHFQDSMLSLHQWLMHPLIDTREPPETV